MFQARCCTVATEGLPVPHRWAFFFHYCGETMGEFLAEVAPEVAKRLTKQPLDISPQGYGVWRR